MKPIEFVEQFPDEQSCQDAFQDYRLKVGVKCRKYDLREHYWMKTVEQFQYKCCRTRTTLRSGTVYAGLQSSFSKVVHCYPFDDFYQKRILCQSIIRAELKIHYSTYEMIQVLGISMLDKTPINELLTAVEINDVKNNIIIN